MASTRPEFSITIPAEIITEILYRLPAKSIGRFRCVSKSWLSQLTDPNFIKIYLNNNNTFTHQKHLIFTTPHVGRFITEKPLFLYSHPFHSREVVVTKPTKFDLQLNFNPYCIDVYGSCDGLVLVSVLLERMTETVVVINPTTKECLQLPQDYNLDDIYNEEHICVCDNYGFGYDSVTDDYKVVSPANYLCDEEDRVLNVRVYVYSLRNKTWRRVSDSPLGYNFTWFGVFVNGFIHWIVRTNEDDECLYGILAFSLADECFSEIPFPRFCNFIDKLTRENCQLLVLGGKLALFIFSEGEIWLMNEYGVRKSWTKIILHGINKVPIFKPELHTPLSVFYDNGKILVANTRRMMVYEVEKARFTETVCVWNPEMFSIAGFYVESLVSPKQGKEEEDQDDNAEDESERETTDNAEDENESETHGDEDTLEGIRENIEFSGEENIHSWKAKHREEKLRADRLKEALNLALSKIQALERRAVEQDDEIEFLNGRAAMLMRRAGRR